MLKRLRQWNEFAEEQVRITGEALHEVLRGGWRAARARLATASAARTERAAGVRASGGSRLDRLRAHLPAPVVSLADRVGRRAPTPRTLWIMVAAVMFANAVLWQTCGLRGCPDVTLLASYQPGGATVLLDRNGKRFADLSPYAHSVVPLKALPDHVSQAFIAVEDKRFYEHNGVDWRRVAGAALANVRAGGAAQGSSTLSMQLARNLFSKRVDPRAKTYHRKLLEVRVARTIEREYEKDEILELYLNHIYFGGGAYGIESAARYYFDKPAKSLTLSQAALLAAIPKAPTHYHPRRRAERARERRNLVLALMAEQGRITAEEAERAQDTRLGVSAEPPSKRSAEDIGRYFIEHVRGVVEEQLGERMYREKLEVYTTLDARAQRAAEEELATQLRWIERGGMGRFTAGRYQAGTVPLGAETEYLQGAVVVLQAKTGEVMALVGGRDFDHSRYDRATRARRQAGSAFKPFVFAAAIDAGVPASQIIMDEPVRLENDGTPWEPKNYDGSFRGPVSVRQALVQSLNVPSVRLAASVGPQNVATLARATGIRADIRETPMVALGIAEVSPLELTTAYATFANLGERVSPRFVRSVKDSLGTVLWSAEPVRRRQVMDPGVAFITTQLMADAVAHGTGTAVPQAGYYGPVAGKTGTTNDGTDAWFIGFTPDIVTGVWVGFDSRRPIAARATGGRAAAPVAGRILRRIYSNRDQPEPWRAPRNVRAFEIDPESGLLLADGCVPEWGPARTEIFLEDAIPEVTCPRQEYIDFWDRLSDWAGRIF